MATKKQIIAAVKGDIDNFRRPLSDIALEGASIGVADEIKRIKTMRALIATRLENMLPDDQV